MIRNQFILDLHAEMIVDNFAGGGGASTGIERALGRCCDIAINHDPEAISMHTANHPQTKHYCEDIWQVDPLEATGGRPVGLAWFSPDCKHFSKAKGGKPRDKHIRGLAWVVHRWAYLVRPRVMMMENVEEFQTWGPLNRNGSPRKAPKYKGKTFRRFVQQLRGLGYVVEWKELRACDHGTPTIRKRLFLIARCDGKPIVWPTPTHAKVKTPGLKPWRTAAECIDFTLPCPSIFERSRGLKEATLRRIARGIQKFVIEAAEPFIVKVNHTAEGYDQFRGQALNEPLQTVTGSHGYGIAIPHVTKFRTGSTGVALSDPMPTITAGPKLDPAGAAHALGLVSATVAPFLTEHANASGQRIFSAEEPLRTQCGEVKGGHFAAVAATLIQTGYGERPGQAPRVPGLEKPLGTIVSGQKHAAVSAFLAKHYTGVVGSGMEEPVHTVTSVDHNALVTANLMVNTTGHSGSAADEPLKTLTTGLHEALVTSHLAKLYGTSTGHDAREPLHTVTGGGQHLAEVRAFLIKYYGEGGQLADCREPMHTVTSKDRVGLVMIQGEEYVITDIGMRMLEPHELYAAQGFPKDYIIAPIVPRKVGKKLIDRPLPKHAQVRMCGNSVCPPMSETLVRANVPELSAWGAGERERTTA